MTEAPMAPAFADFVDVTGANSVRVPVSVSPKMIALYINEANQPGPDWDGIEATTAEAKRFTDAKVSIIWIDQTVDLAQFAAGHAPIADMETNAGTPQAAAAGCKQREARGQRSTIYLSQSRIPEMHNALQSAGVNMSLVGYGVANYSLSRAQATALLDANPNWDYVQFGDNITNAGTPVPGTNVTCGQAGCDIDVAKASWAAQFLPKPPPPPVLGRKFQEEAMPELHNGANAVTPVAVAPGSATAIHFSNDASGQGLAPAALRVAIHSASKGWSQIEQSFELPSSGGVAVKFTEHDVDAVSVERRTGSTVAVGYILS